MRIVFVLSGLGAGGAERVVNILAHHRAAVGDEVHVLAVNAASLASYFPYEKSIAIEALGDNGSHITYAFRVAGRVARLRGRLRALQPDLVISFLTKINIMVVLATRGLDLRVVLSERNNYTAQEMSPLWRLSRPLAARSAERLVMQTTEAVDSLPANLRSKAVIIPNPVTLQSCCQSGGDGTRVLAVGRLDKQKGFDLLIDAFAAAAGHNANLTLTIFGDGPERAALEQKVRHHGLGERVRLPGTTKSPADWMEAGDIFVLSSRFEGFPNVLIEAMSAGLASVAFDCPWGPSEIIDTPEIGLLVPLNDVEQLAAAMHRLASQPRLRKSIGTAGARAVAVRYAASSVLRQWDNVIAPPRQSEAVRPLEHDLRHAMPTGQHKVLRSREDL